MSQQQNISIDSRKLFNLAANLISAGFYKQKPEEAKKLFKTLKQGNLVKAGELKSENNNMIIPVKLALDYSEFSGQFNYPNFDTCLKALLQRFQTFGRQDKELKELRTLTNEETGEVIFNLPGLVQIGEDVNMLMAAVLPQEDHLVVRLLFIDPTQFKKED